MNIAVPQDVNVLANPVAFKVNFAYKNKTIEVEKFNSFVQRKIKLSDNVNVDKKLTAAKILADGTLLPVPTKIEKIHGQNYAVMSSLTNSTYVVVSKKIKFKDMDGHWGNDVVSEMASRLIINGVESDIYSPDRNITRAEFVALITRALGLSGYNGTVAFKDINPRDWYYSPVNTAIGYGLIKGYSDNTFKPGKEITREEAVTIVMRAIKLAGMNTAITSSDSIMELQKFSDNSEVSRWAEDSMAICIKYGIVNGINTTLKPKGNTTRVQAAKMLLYMLYKAEVI